MEAKISFKSDTANKKDKDPIDEGVKQHSNQQIVGDCQGREELLNEIFYGKYDSKVD